MWSYTDTPGNAKLTRLGAGFKNTISITKSLGDPQNEADDYAALECAEFSDNGYSNWYLPSKDELNEMYKQKNIIGNFTPFAYWSSSEADASEAWFQNFSDGLQVKAAKINSYALRPVKYF